MKKERACVGMDESNHGRIPEIYVAVFSEYIEDMSPTEGLKKKRNRGNIDRILKGRDFRFMLIGREHKKLLRDSDIFIMCGCEFIKYFAISNPEKEIDYIFDHEQKRYYIPRTQEILKKNLEGQILIANQRIRIEPKADLRYPIVNIADHIARLLHRKYRDIESICDYFPEKMITPRLEDYAEFIREKENHKEGYFRRNHSNNKLKVGPKLRVK